MKLTAEFFDEKSAALPQASREISGLGEVKVYGMTCAQRFDLARGRMTELEMIAHCIPVDGEFKTADEWSRFLAHLPSQTVVELTQAIADLSEDADAKKD